MCALRVDGAHEGYLLSTLGDILLVYAEGIYPYSSRSIREAETTDDF
jgi:hypothetical protein